MPAAPRELHPDVVRRVAALVSGPHACPECHGPTWTTPPDPWPAMRDFVAECSMCRRPLQVRVRPDLVLRGGPMAEDTAPQLDPVTELLESPGIRPFLRRLAVAALPVAVALALVGSLLGWRTGFILVALLVVPCAMWAPSIAANLVADLRRRAGRTHSSVERGVELSRARWRQLERERFLHRRETLDGSSASVAATQRSRRSMRATRRRTQLVLVGDAPLDEDDGSGHAAAG